MDTIVISNLVVPVKVGVSTKERAKVQSIRIDVEIGTTFKNVIATLDLRKGLDYADVRRVIIAGVEDKPFTLLESLGNYLMGQIFEEAIRAEEITITVSKIALWPIAVPGIRMKRTRAEWRKGDD